MASLRDQFQHFYKPGDDEVVKAIKTGIVTPDTNVLLALYRLQPDMRDQWFGALAALNDRLWVPHQVATEFHRRRLDVIKEKERSFKATEDELRALFKSLRAKVEQFGTSIGLEKDHIQGVTEGITSLQTSLTAEVNAAKKANDVRFLGTNTDKSDKVFERLDNLLGDRIGDAMSPAALAEAQTEALRRVGLEIPPGYEDAGKVNPSGDYLVFRQVMDHAREHKLPVVLVTDDVKGDWYRRQQEIDFGARAELREEVMLEAGVPFITMTTKTFLEHAKAHLGAAVSPETVEQAKELPRTALTEWQAQMPTLLHLALTDEGRSSMAAAASRAAAVHFAELPDEARSWLLGEGREAIISRYLRDRPVPPPPDFDKWALRVLAARDVGESSGEEQGLRDADQDDPEEGDENP